MIPYFQWTQIDIGPIPIHVWGLMVALGILTSLAITVHMARKESLSVEQCVDMAFWMVLASMLGSRVLYVLGEWQYYIQFPLDIFKVWQGGMAFSGGFLGAVLAGYIYVRKHTLPLVPYAEVFVFGLPFGLAVGRLGCFFIFDHPGTPTQLFFGQVYIDGIVRHNHGLYLSLTALGIGLLFLLFRRLKPTRMNGMYSILFFLLYGISRFILDFWRATDVAHPDPRFFGLTIAQYISLGLVVVAVALWYSMKRTDDSYAISTKTKHIKKTPHTGKKNS